MTAARPTAEVKRDPEHDKREEGEREVRKFHTGVQTSMTDYMTYGKAFRTDGFRPEFFGDVLAHYYIEGDRY